MHEKIYVKGCGRKSRADAWGGGSDRKAYGECRMMAGKIMGSAQECGRRMARIFRNMLFRMKEKRRQKNGGRKIGGDPRCLPLHFWVE